MIFFKLLLFILSFSGIFSFSFFLSKKIFKINEFKSLFLATLILNVSISLIISNFLLYFKIYKFIIFSSITIPLNFLYIKNPLKFELKNPFLSLPVLYKVIFFIFLFLIIFIFLEALITPPLSWDSLRYHMLFSSLYVQKGSFFKIELDGFTETFLNFPKNYEIFLSNFLLPFSSDFLSNICNFYFLLILITSSLIFLENFNFKRERKILFILNLITIPSFFIYLPTQYIEIASASLLFSGISFISLFEKEKNQIFLFLSSLSFSLALSFKINNLGPFLISHLFIIYLFLKNKNKKYFFLMIFLLLAFSLHYIKAIINFKNPVYPYPLKILNFKIGERDERIISFLNEIREKEEEYFHSKVKNLSQIEKKLAPYFYTITSIFSQNRQALGRQAFLYLALGFISLIFFKNKFWKIFFLLQIFVFLFQFFNPAYEPLRIIYSISYSRFWIFIISIFLFLSLKILENYKIYEIIFVIGFISNIFLILPIKFLNIHIFLFFLSTLISISFLLFFFKKPKTFLLAFICTFLFFSPFILKIKEGLRYFFYFNYYNVSEISKAIFPASKYLDGKKTTINIRIIENEFDKNFIFYYPLLGRNFENEIKFIRPENENKTEWLKNLKKENVKFLIYNNINLTDFKWCYEDRKNFKLVFFENGIYLFNFNPI